MNFEFTTSIELNNAVLRKTLEKVRDQLLNHEINGGDKKLHMNGVCHKTDCGTAACIGGWASIFLLGFEGGDKVRVSIVENLFSALLNAPSTNVDKRNLWKLFYNFHYTYDYNEPNIAATAIQRYLDGKGPWPKGEMPNVLPYKRRRAVKR